MRSESRESLNPYRPSKAPPFLCCLRDRFQFSSYRETVGWLVGASIGCTGIVLLDSQGCSR